eukprot:CAMPEP_0177663546 /NCGR_PEP_ID=MMETSP0447-20121125/19976_1 /TAXON_ID=0 /ORGANISM="Stygamoeba regulata, Strain BSH-02190019" /LENGTH=219 /DNA_ID=CAMNT_0019169375 /DNA_START=40 /DNA_END=699 /DNA_ORIENTATION=-
MFRRAATQFLRHGARYAGTRSFSAGTRAAQSSAAPLALALGAGVAGGLFLLDSTAAHAAEVPHVGIPGTVKERTFIAIKPDGVQRGLINTIIKKFERKGYKLVGIKILNVSEAHAREHYADLSDKPFFPKLVKYFTSGPVVAMVWEGRDVISTGRKLVGATNPKQSEMGSIRGDLCIDIGRNIIHGSDSPDSARDEISLWFKEGELASYGLDLERWVFE